jgi:uncharacterized membrane protein
MKTLFAITYPAVADAQAALEKLRAEQKAETIAMIDAVIVTRGEDGSVKLGQMINTTALGAASGALWGSLIGLIFLAPVVGAAFGATAGAVSGYFTDYGISDSFMKDLGAKTSGAGATLFVLAAQMTSDRIADALGSPTANVLYTSMPDDIEARFKSHFGPAAGQPAAATAQG